MTVLENDMTFMMCVVLQGDAAVPVIVTLIAEPGSALPGEGVCVCVCVCVCACFVAVSIRQYC